jgi:hypothetical protein
MKPSTNDEQDVELGRIAAEIEAEAAKARRYRRIDFWTPYPKQAEFFATGLRCRERGLFAGTQLGKTEALSFEVAVHLTGLYPPDWPGRKWDRPIRGWAVGENQKQTRDIMQRKLGESNCFDTIQVRHKSGGTSVLRFRTYQAGAMVLQGETLDVVWLDEEPSDYAVYSECLARVGGTGGLCRLFRMSGPRGWNRRHAHDRVHAATGHVGNLSPFSQYIFTRSDLRPIRNR